MPACDQSPSSLIWQVRKDRKKRAVNLRFRRETVAGAPLKPVQVQIARPRGTRSFEWTELNREHYAYRRRGGEAAALTARYVENSSGYGQIGTPDRGLPALPLLPGITLPALPLPPVPLPVVPLILGPAGGAGGQYQGDLCVRTITRTVR